VLAGVAAGGVIAFAMASPRGKTLLRNLPRMLADLTRQSERVLGLVRELTTEIEQSLQKVEAGLENVEQALNRDQAESGAPTLQAA
jgi:phage shock protein A